MKEVIMQVQSFSADYPKASIYVGDLVRCKDCRWWSCTDSLYQHNSHLCRYWKSTNTSAEDFCSYGERQCNYFGERKEPLPQYEEWQDEFNKMCEGARPKNFVADEWYRDTFKGEEE